VTRAQSQEDAVEIERAKYEIDTYGFVVLENQIPTADVDRMADRLMTLMRAQPNADKLEQNLQSLLNLDDIFVPLGLNETFLELARYKLGEGFRFAGVAARWIKPGAPAQKLHADLPASHMPEPMPDGCFVLNAIWMLTDFTRENGATRFVPCSHLTRRRPSGPVPEKYGVAAEAPRGSVVIFNGMIWHGSGANVTRDQQRLGVAGHYFTAWTSGAPCPAKPTTACRL